MTWGASIASAYNTASAGAKSLAQSAMSSIGTAATAVKNVGGFGLRAAGETAVAAAQAHTFLADKVLSSTPLLGRAYTAAKQMLSPTQPPRKRAIEPCLNSWEGKKQRLEERKALIGLGNTADASPAQKAAAVRLSRNSDAVELAKLSDDTYDQFKTPKDPKHSAPLGWTPMSNADLAKAGIDPQLLADSKAVVYQTPKDWPGGQKTVLAFRGTVPTESADLTTNIDQALGRETAQYEAAKQLGQDMSTQFGSNVVVTGHSLGGGKAQAAGASGGLKGTMFNSAGLNADTVGGKLPDPSNFTQFRAPGDPLTGFQNSAALQAAGVPLIGGLGGAAGASNFVAQQLGIPSLSKDHSEIVGKVGTAMPSAIGNLAGQGNFLPPAVGKVVVVPSFDGEGNPVTATDPGGSHSVTNLVNGIEREKSEDVATLKGIT
jgi:hypothetical protein